MVSHDKPTPRKKKGKNQKKKLKSDQSLADPSEDGCTYGIDRLNLGKPANDSESDPKSENKSEWLLAHRREGHMENKENRNNSTKRECNVLSSFFNLYKIRKT